MLGGLALGAKAPLNKRHEKFSQREDFHQEDHRLRAFYQDYRLGGGDMWNALMTLQRGHPPNWISTLEHPRPKNSSDSSLRNGAVLLVST